MQKYDELRYYLFRALMKSEYDEISTLLRDAHNALGRLERERDALIEELKNTHACYACRNFHRNGGECNGGSVCMMRDFEWRGVKEADDGNRDNDG